MIRKYRETDIEELLDVWYNSTQKAHSFLDDAFLQKEKKNIRDIYIPKTKTWVYANPHGLDGFISMMENEVAAVFVRPELFGKGIGKMLMGYVGQFYNPLEVEVFKENMIGRAFYDRYGFQTFEEHLHEETGRMLLRMRFKK